jgi:hypothetical protein
MLLGMTQIGHCDWFSVADPSQFWYLQFIGRMGDNTEDKRWPRYRTEGGRRQMDEERERERETTIGGGHTEQNRRWKVEDERSRMNRRERKREIRGDSEETQPPNL